MFFFSCFMIYCKKLMSQYYNLLLRWFRVQNYCTTIDTSLTSSVCRKTPRTDKQRDMVMIIRVVDPEANRNFIQKWGAVNVGALGCKIITRVEYPLVRPGRKLFSFQSWTAFQPTVVVCYKVSNQSRRFGRRKPCQSNPHLLGWEQIIKSKDSFERR